MEDKIKMPGFRSEASLAKESYYHGNQSNYSATGNKNIILPSYSRSCNRLLHICITGTNPRSNACDTWLLNCF
jgi:hypothetical protein